MPGEITFTRTGPSSRAIAFTNPSRPQFTMLVMELFGAGRAPRMPEKSVNEPSAEMRGAPCFTRKIGAHSLASIAVRMSSARSSTIGPDTPAPIVLTR